MAPQPKPSSAAPAGQRDAGLPDAADVLACMGDGVYVVDRERRISSWNPAAERLTGYPSDEVVGHRCADGLLMHVDEAGTLLCRAGCPLAATMADGRRREARVYVHHRDGSRRPIWVRAAPLLDDDGEIVGAVEVFNADGAGEEVRALLREARARADSDPLTGLGNRRSLEARLDGWVQDLERSGGPFGVVFIDVDGFKEVNDRFGHDVGDAVLTMVATTISHATQLTDVVTRLGGDEFVVLVSCDGRDELAACAERIRRLIHASTLSGNAGDGIHVSVSIGAALAHPGDDPRALLRRADRRMYRAKHAGGDRSDAGGPDTPPTGPTTDGGEA